MVKHKRVYLKALGAGEQDIVFCEVCHAPAVDIHHIIPKGMGGRANADVEENLIALCRHCHEAAHQNALDQSRLQKIAWDRITRLHQ